MRNIVGASADVRLEPPDRFREAQSAGSAPCYTRVMSHPWRRDTPRAEERVPRYVGGGAPRPARGLRFVTAEAAVSLFRLAAPVDHDRLRADLDDLLGQDPHPRG